jgi:hypothetical protein
MVTVDDDTLRMFKKQYPYIDTFMANIILSTPIEKLDEIMVKCKSNPKFKVLPVTETILDCASIYNIGDDGHDGLSKSSVPNLNLIVE